MEEKDKKSGEEGCDCRMCRIFRCSHDGRHRFLKLILKLAVLAAVFCIGVKFGEIKSRYFRSYRGYQTSQMMYRDAGNRGFYGSGIMSEYYRSAQQQSTTTP